MPEQEPRPTGLEEIDVQSCQDHEPPVPEIPRRLHRSLYYIVPNLYSLGANVTVGFLGADGETRMTTSVATGLFFIGALYLLENTSSDSQPSE